MDRKIWLAIPVGIVVALLAGPACHSSSSSSTDDDDDFSPPAQTCESVYWTIYNTCGISFVDDQGDRVSLNAALILCAANQDPYGVNGPYAECIVASSQTCDTLEDCLLQATGG